MFDVIGSKENMEYISTRTTKFFDLIETIYSLLELEEEKTNTNILLKDDLNIKFSLSDERIDTNKSNPMILGDMMTFFVHNNSISTERMLEIFTYALNFCDINYPFHFNSGCYETNRYREGNTKLFKGYMPQILESLSKSNHISIDKYYNINYPTNNIEQ